MKPLQYLAIASLSLALGYSSLAQAAQQPCAQDAVKQAAQLLNFHVNGDDRAEVDNSVTVLSPIKSPANPKQRFDVLEAWGNVYKGRYRMHLIYAQIPGQCVLMGQEIIEYASL